jgi:hypothetical protein
VLKRYARKSYGADEMKLHAFLNMAEMKGCDQLHTPASLSPRKEPPVLTGEEAQWDPEPVWTRWQRKIPICVWNRIQLIIIHLTD